MDTTFKNIRLSTKMPVFMDRKCTAQGSRVKDIQKKSNYQSIVAFLSGYCDSNTGPSGPKPDALANCATPRLFGFPHLGLQIYDEKIKVQNFFTKFCTFCVFRDSD